MQLGCTTVIMPTVPRTRPFLLENANGRTYSKIYVETIIADSVQCRKHMDKHTRPYVCEEPECENIRGFTYSGGLLRHQREVHRQHGGPRAARMCPHKDCKRSTGVGFSRKENLQEHLRRVHRDVDSEAKKKRSFEKNSSSDAEIGGGTPLFSSSQTQQTSTRKRRRRAIEDEATDADNLDIADLDDEQTTSQGLRQQVKKLRRELRDRDERLRKLEERFEELARSRRL